MVLWIKSGTAQRSVCFLFSISAQILLQMQTDIPKLFWPQVRKQLEFSRKPSFSDEETETKEQPKITAECGSGIGASTHYDSLPPSLPGSDS